MQPLTSSSGALRILVADDHPDSAETMQILLRLWGHEVVIARSGQEALAVVQEFKPQIAFLDFLMPDLNGGEVAKRMRQLPGLERLIIIAATAHEQDDETFVPYHKLFDYHLLKPFKLSELEKLLASYNSVAEPADSSGETGT
jgi:CheY-like chemotaxis protein